MLFICYACTKFVDLGFTCEVKFFYEIQDKGQGLFFYICRPIVSASFIEKAILSSFICLLP